MEGLGTTIDVVLVNGVLHEGDQIVVCGMQVCHFVIPILDMWLERLTPQEQSLACLIFWPSLFFATGYTLCNSMWKLPALSTYLAHAQRTLVLLHT